jgi:tetratricopeptide (TPR) repeat protein
MTSETAVANVTKTVVQLLEGFSVSVPDAEYDATAVQLLPSPPSATELPLSPDVKYNFAVKYKEAGNALFKQGHHAHALRTYLVGAAILAQLGYDDPAQLMYDLDAHPICIACYSNGALMALKLARYELAAQLCERGLGFAPSGPELAKLLIRKAQAFLDRPEHADPLMAVECCELANKAHNSRPVLELLQRAKKAAKAAEKAADQAFFGGRGFGTKSLAADSTKRSDASAECADLLRSATAALLGTTAARTVDPYQEARLHESGEEAPKKDVAVARATFLSAVARARSARLRPEEAHGFFGQGAAASELGEWREAADCFSRYFRLADALRSGHADGTDRGADDRSAATSGAISFREPHLGDAFGRFRAGMALYELREVDGATRELEAYLQCKEQFQERRICFVDAWGNETYPDLEKEEQRQRKWAVCGRVEFSARRHLGHLKQLAASAAGAREPVATLDEALEQLAAARALAWEEAQRHEIDEQLERTHRARRALVESLEDQRRGLDATPPPHEAATEDET